MYILIIIIIFTFQYGSTYIHLSMIPQTPYTAFTFQYGSTYIHIQTKANIDSFDLHSNMVLLIFVCILSLSYVKAYLHSNMVLLIFTLLFF